MNPARVKSASRSCRCLWIVLFFLSTVAGCESLCFYPAHDTLARGVQPDTLPLPHPKSTLPDPKAILLAPTSHPAKALPISLDTVFRLAHDQNGQIALGREKLNESYANRDLADMAWMPDLYVGTTYARHEGGISDFFGNLIQSSYGTAFAGAQVQGKFDLRDITYKKIDAERQVWQKKGELSKLTSENLLDASSTYVDLLAAYTGEAIAHEMEVKLEDLLSRAQKLENVDRGAAVEVTRVRAELSAQKQITRKLREGINSATAKLIYLLGLEPGSELVPIERQIKVLKLVNANLPAQILVDQALLKGPGVRELTSLLRVIDEARDKANGLGKYLPIFEITANEGLFGTGPDANMQWANQLNVAVTAKWNLTDGLLSRQRMKITDSKMQQAQLAYRELKGKLALGVQEAREASLSNIDMMAMGKAQIESNEKSYELSDYRLKNNIKGASPFEVMMSIRGVIGARLTYLNAVRELNKSQLRLFILVGAADCKE